MPHTPTTPTQTALPTAPPAQLGGVAELLVDGLRTAAGTVHDLRHQLPYLPTIPVGELPPALVQLDRLVDELDQLLRHVAGSIVVFDGDDAAPTCPVEDQLDDAATYLYRARHHLTAAGGLIADLTGATAAAGTGPAGTGAAAAGIAASGTGAGR